MNKAYLDTTIVTDALLKSGAPKQAARRALQRYEVTELPVYAIKEFKAGPLKNFAWMHNKLATLGSFQRALDALHRMSRTPKRYTTSTAIEALRDATSSIAKQTTGDLVKKYGNSANHDAVLCDEFRLAIKTAIIKAWKARRRLATRVVHELPCYTEVDLLEERGLLVVERTRCDPNPECSLAVALKARPTDLRKLKGITETQPQRPELQRRSRTLRQLFRRPKMPMTEAMCRDLGDAYFAFFAPHDSTILTTNERDHEPLAAVLGKNIATPQG